VQVGGVTIRAQSVTKYLGVILGTRLSFKEHLEYAQKKANGTVGALFRLLLNTRGAKHTTIKLLASAVWADAA
ncbi:hypothetical protein KR054_009318, partial [Drosophila jambulina]